jgi:ABC-type polar amino acid transport system ATPase subunit
MMDEDKTTKLNSSDAYRQSAGVAPTIIVKELIKKHGKNEVIKGISMEVNKGEVAVVIGPSGGGKSTFIRCLNGLEMFQGGEIQIGNIHMKPFLSESRDSALLRNVRQRVGFVFQSFNLFPHMTVIENIIEGPTQVLKKSKEEASEKALKLLERVGLLERKNHLPRQLSGGQMQNSGDGARGHPL